MTLTQRIAAERALEEASRYAEAVAEHRVAAENFSRDQAELDLVNELAATSQQAWDDLRTAVETAARA